MVPGRRNVLKTPTCRRACRGYTRGRRSPHERRFYLPCNVVIKSGRRGAYQPGRRLATRRGEEVATWMQSQRCTVASLEHCNNVSPAIASFNINLRVRNTHRRTDDGRRWRSVRVRCTGRKGAAGGKRSPTKTGRTSYRFRRRTIDLGISLYVTGWFAG